MNTPTCVVSSLIPIRINWIAFLATAIFALDATFATHKIGDVVVEGIPPVVGNGTVTVPFLTPQSQNVRFSILNFTNNIGAGDQLVVEYQDAIGNTISDIFDSSSPSDFWTRPIRGDSPISLRYLDNGNNNGSVSLDRWARSQEMVLGGANASSGGNANGDTFLLESPFDNPTAFNASGTFGSGLPQWQNIASLNNGNDPTGIKRQVARSTGMIVIEHDNVLSTCSASLIDADLILTNAHCVSNVAELAAGSFTADFFTDASNNRVDVPSAYNPSFYKLKNLVKAGFSGTAQLDYAIIQLDTGPTGVRDRFGDLVPPLTMKPLANNNGLPVGGEELFIIHHPRAASKKISRQGAGGNCVASSVGTASFSTSCDGDNGSSGSPVFDLNGNIVGVSTWVSNGVDAVSTAAIQRNLNEDLPSGLIDASIVFDRSGSMLLSSGLGTTKLQEAKAAASLFVDLVNSSVGHEVGLVTFSTSADAPAPSPNVALQPVTNASKNNLIGADRQSGIVGGISANGNTSIGAGLSAAQSQLNSGANTPAMLLLTDGLHNTPPSIASVNLADTRLNIIGFGSESSLDGPGMTQLARDHGGIYTRAGDGLELKKFFALAFGEMFNSGTSLDPYFVWPKDETKADTPLLQTIGSEHELTVVMGWESESDRKWIEVVSPEGNIISARTPGVTASDGEKWRFLKIPLPFNGEQEGVWQIQGERGFAQEFFTADPENFFITTIVDGGPEIRALSQRKRIYTGDTINPFVDFRNEDGTLVDDAVLTVEVRQPLEGTGNFLVARVLDDTMTLGGDTIDQRVTTLMNAEGEGKQFGFSKTTFPLFDDGERDDLSLEENGVYGNPLSVAGEQGHYEFLARATFGNGQTRETSWSFFVDVGIDSENTEVEIGEAIVLDDGRKQAEVVFTPRDQFGNYLGPVRADGFDLELLAPLGSEFLGSLVDNGDGSYSQTVIWDMDQAMIPTLVLKQPDRDFQILTPEPTSGHAVWFLLLFAVMKNTTKHTKRGQR